MRPAGDTTRDATRDRDGGASNLRARDDDAREARLSKADGDETGDAAGESPEDADDSPEDARAGRSAGASSRMIDALPGSPQFWSTVCVACLVVSAALILTGRVEAAFVTATLGVLAWFINVRNGLRGDDAAETNTGQQGKDDDK